MSSILQNHLRLREDGTRSGIYSVCSAHPLVLRAAAEQAVADRSLLLIEATSNQVNQMGGYTGMQPSDFRRFAETIATAAHLEPQRLVLGGDHLGPNPWRHLPASEAMQYAKTMVSAYAKASFSKIHLDASMSCLDDPAILSDEEVAHRSAALCTEAEAAYADEITKPVYVIGTEVPTPGGATHSLNNLSITPPKSASRTLSIHRQVFMKHGLGDAWKRVIAMVVQPGVEFDHDSVVHYQRSKAKALVEWRQQENSDIVFEAHSTDYQLPHAYGELVHDGFAILKVGPAMTFALREAMDAFAAIEELLIAPEEQSKLLQTLEQTMIANPQEWRPYYEGSPSQQQLLRRFSYSDRVRYYWHNPEVVASVSRLIRNLETTKIPESVLSLFMPAQYARLRLGQIPYDPTSLIVDKVKDVLRVYAKSCSPGR
ncbi:D-tagatose-bisphosphate aldolase, class II, non-catalytic subunit [Tunturiibacter empetritectus]|uniref:D-tagatose-1,6-bisphosphate aldolase subunit GatZ/KbaZ n=2 Tax=Tunturiibacter TaxID=3154218 RepID=A0A852V7L5_9BACT|nr:D-tagatose-bisphosphate aldolase, class II, non-catalytic subunit [Edaphobacter lichenicola]NYF88913.1 D-tagatose-1,6-bisphosphate aldolase subunit GatZ/KbaZ [Edaphobacter lichenicola]